MSKLVVSFKREFQVWSYTVGHGRLLLRSPKAPAQPTRVDILFTDVRAVEIRTNLSSLTIQEAELEEVAQRPIKPQQALETGHRIFLLKSADWVGCVVAGSVHWREDQGEYGEPSGLMGRS